MKNLSETEKNLIDVALQEYAKKLDKLMSQCLKQEQKSAAEKVLANVKIINNIRDVIKE